MNFLAISSLINFLAACGLAIIVLQKCPQRMVARAYTIFNLSLAFYSFFYYLWQMTQDPTRAMLYHQLLFLGVIWIQQALLYFVFSFLDIVTEKKAILWGAAAINLVFSVMNMTGLLYPTLEPRFGIGFWPNPTPWAVLYIVFWHLECFYFFGLLLFAAIKSYRDGHQAYARQVTYMVVAFNIGYFGGATNWPVWFKKPIPPYLNSLIAVYVAIIAYAIVKHRLMDMNVIIKKTLVYSIITTSLAVVYLGVVTLCAQVLQGWVGFSREFSAGIAAAVVAILFHPWRSRVQSFVDRKFFRTAADAGHRLEAISSLTSMRHTPRELAQALFEVLDEAYHPLWISLYLRSLDNTFVRYAPIVSPMNVPADPELPEKMPSDNLWARCLSSDQSRPPEVFSELARMKASAVFPLRSQTMLLGYLFVGGKKSEEPYTEHDALLVRIAVNETALAFEQMVNAKEVGQRAPATLLQDVASGFVHEIKTPLANISLPAQASFAELMAVEQGRRKMEDLLPKMKERMRFIMTQAVKAGDRIDAIREFAAVEDTRLEPVELSAVIHECLGTLTPLIDQAEVHTKVNFEKVLTLVRGNAKQLEIVFTNLIKNAVEAMRDGIPDPSRRFLRIEMTIENNFHVVSLQDSGPGIKAADMTRLFEKHFTTKGAAGTGVGLHLSQQIIQVHGGTMDVKSEENTGTTFTVRLPVLQNS